MKSQKRKCFSKNRDRLSEMPDDVIVHILSYLPAVDAVRTMLIRRFGNLWTLMSNLMFEDKEILNKIDPDCTWENNDAEWFPIFIRNVLMLHKRPVIDKFHLLLEWVHSKSEAGDDVTMWLRFALDKQAKEIVFRDVGSEFINGDDFPDFLISQSLVTLELSHCFICKLPQVNLGSLKKLILCHTDMSDGIFQDFICGSPSLQELRIVEPFCCKYESISAPNIRKLSLIIIEDDKDVDPWLLDFPKLKSLELGINRIPKVIDVSSVRDVYLKELCFDMDDENEFAGFNLFLEKFSCSDVFQLSCNASEPFLHSIDDSRLLQIRWKRVVLHLCIFCQSCLLGIYHLMRSSIHLEELIIYTDTSLTNESVCNTPSLFSGLDCKDSTDLPLVELSNPCVMPKLRTVTLHGYGKACKHQLQLVEFLLRSATVLEKLVIVPNKSQLTLMEKLVKLDFVTHVSSFQRSSPSARVLFL
ncbi:F-box/FBD/LRR-repeat protein At1g13570-like [Silene latifolia]|uniref:F-box/FBD/LRR-repeat protein At1g13570-like n=1 Tax=Silene latifolia TaxID=37657 RepID=UPI003D76FC37